MMAFTKASESILRGDWSEASVAGEEAVHAAPDFGPARVLYAHALANIGDVTQANEQMSVASSRLTSLTPELRRMIDAQLAAMSHTEPAAAIEAYERISNDYPYRMEFQLTYAHLLVQARRVEKAISILSGTEWKKASLTLQVQRLIGLSHAYARAGLPLESRRHAEDAIAMIETSGVEQKQNLGEARLHLAHALEQLNDPSFDPEMYAQAADEISWHGDTLYSDYARLLAKQFDGDAKATREMAERFLERSRNGGDRNFELAALETISFAMYEEGDMAGHRSTLRTALEIAILSGHAPKQQTLMIDMLRDMLRTGDFGSAERFVKTIRKNQLWGSHPFTVARYEAELHQARGDYGKALSVLDEVTPAQDKGSHLSNPSKATVLIHCARVSNFLAMGRTQDAERALSACRHSSSTSVAFFERLKRSEYATSIGKPDLAVLALSGVEGIANDAVDANDAVRLTSVADALVEAREYSKAEAIYSRILSITDHAGYTLVSTKIRIGLAQCAVARKDIAAAQKRLGEAREAMPRLPWVISRRAIPVSIAIESAGGDHATARQMLASFNAEASSRQDAQAVNSMIFSQRH